MSCKSIDTRALGECWKRPDESRGLGREAVVFVGRGDVGGRPQVRPRAKVDCVWNVAPRDQLFLELGQRPRA